MRRQMQNGGGLDHMNTFVHRGRTRSLLHRQFGPCQGQAGESDLLEIYSVPGNSLPSPCLGDLFEFSWRV